MTATDETVQGAREKALEEAFHPKQPDVEDGHQDKWADIVFYTENSKYLVDLERMHEEGVPLT